MMNGMVEPTRTWLTISSGVVMSVLVQLTVRPVSRSNAWMRRPAGLAQNVSQSKGSVPSWMARS